jgi:hypothetical protein
VQDAGAMLVLLLALSPALRTVAAPH